MKSFDVTTSPGSEKNTLSIKKIVAWVVLVAIILIAIAVPIAVVLSARESNDVIDTSGSITCFPLDSDVTQDTCTKAGCVWSNGTNGLSCYVPNNALYGYQIASQTSDENGIRANLLLTSNFSLYGSGFKEVVFEVMFYTERMLGFTIYNKEYGPDYGKAPVPMNIPTPTSKPANSLYEVRLVNATEGSPFAFQILRSSTKTVIFDTSVGGLTLAEQFLMISTLLPSDRLYGIGENTHNSFKHDMNNRMWPLFARDQPPGGGGMNLYGSHPFYTCTEYDGSAHGVFFFNSHSIDVTTLPNPGIIYRTVGGHLEFYVFMGPSHEDVVSQYTEMIGRPYLVPYWGLGFQLSRYGYNNLENLQLAVNTTRDHQIPQDVQYVDIDYMDERMDFTIDPVNFAGLSDYVEAVKTSGLRFITILDPAIITNLTEEDYPPYARGKNASVFIKWANRSLVPDDDYAEAGMTMLGYVWPKGKVAFPDFFKSETHDWWADEIEVFYNKLKFDGLWIDMNEPSSFDTNLEKPFNWPDDALPYWNLKCPTNQWDDPPYVTKAATLGPSYRISDKTLCMVGVQGPKDEYLHYEVHNLFGWSQSEPSLRAAQSATGNRSVVISRSTYPSSGKWVGHWLGDNASTWEQLKQSIIGILEFNLFGIPYIGADICGYFDNTTEELCARWMELGAFYTFSRNHNGLGYIPQDPGQWEVVAQASRTALNARYRLLPFLYTLFYHANTNGGTVLRPLFHEFPLDNETYGIDEQFLWGPSLLISPVVHEGVTDLKMYLPEDVWYDYFTGEREEKTGFVNKPTPVDSINLHIRGGSILPAQTPAMNTRLSRQNNFELVVALSDDQAAYGDLYWDDGEVVDPVTQELYSLYKFSYETTAVNDNQVGTLRMDIVKPQPSLWSSIMMGTIEILGAPSCPSQISLTVSSDTYANFTQYTCNDITKKLVLEMRIGDVQPPMSEAWEVTVNY